MIFIHLSIDLCLTPPLHVGQAVMGTSDYMSYLSSTDTYSLYEDCSSDTLQERLRCKIFNIFFAGVRLLLHCFVNMRRVVVCSPPVYRSVLNQLASIN